MSPVGPGGERSTLRCLCWIPAFCGYAEPFLSRNPGFFCHTETCLVCLSSLIAFFAFLSCPSGLFPWGYVSVLWAGRLPGAGGFFVSVVSMPLSREWFSFLPYFFFLLFLSQLFIYMETTLVSSSSTYRIKQNGFYSVSLQHCCTFHTSDVALSPL